MPQKHKHSQVQRRNGTYTNGTTEYDMVRTRVRTVGMVTCVPYLVWYTCSTRYVHNGTMVRTYVRTYVVRMWYVRSTHVLGAHACPFPIRKL